MKLIDVVKGLVQEFWRDNSRPSSNQKDVLKLRMGSRDHEPHTKKFLDRHKHNYMRDLGMNIMNLTWAKDPLRNENHGMLK